MKEMTKEIMIRKIRKITFKAIFTIILGLLKIAHEVFRSMFDNCDSFDGKAYCDAIFDMGKIEDKIDELFKIVNV